MSEPDYQIRLARAAEATLIPELENAAGELFREVGLDWASELQPMPASEVERAILGEGVFVIEAADAVGSRLVAGYALVWWRGAECYLRELDVRPEFGRRGFGRALVTHVAAQARSRGCTQVVLTTFRDVPWNAPWYRRIGFEEFLPEAGSWVAAERATEACHGLDRAARVAMRLWL